MQPTTGTCYYPFEAEAGEDPMRTLDYVRSVLLLTCGVGVFLTVPAGRFDRFDLAEAAEPLTIDGLPQDPKAYRAQIEQLLKKVDELVNKLKGNPEALPVVLDLQQTRDDIMRELPKAETVPDGAKWTIEEGRASIEAKLQLLKALYDKASDL